MDYTDPHINIRSTDPARPCFQCRLRKRVHHDLRMAKKIEEELEELQVRKVLP
jgi:hypothetical protein